MKSSFQPASALRRGTVLVTSIVTGMGRVRIKTVKKAARVVVEKDYAKLTLVFQVDKEIAEEVASISSKRMRNKIGRLR